MEALVPRKPPGAKARGLGVQLRACRENAGLTLRAAAEIAGWDKSALSRLETGSRDSSVEEVALLVGVYRVTGELRDRLLAMARAVDEPGWWGYGNKGVPPATTALADYESEAIRIADWSPLIVPGLLQTADYMQAWMLTGAVESASIELKVATRLRRQRILAHSIDYVAFVGEPALRTPVGDAATSAKQLAVLREMGQRRNGSVRVVPSDAGPHQGQIGAFHTMEFPAAPPVVLIETLQSSLFLDEAKQTLPYFETLSRLAEIALSETESARLITRIQSRWQRNAASALMASLSSADVAPAERG